MRTARPNRTALAATSLALGLSLALASLLGGAPGASLAQDGTSERAAEKPLPAGAIARPITPTAEPTANLLPTVAFSPDSRMAIIVTGTAGARTAALYETAKWTRVRELGAAGRWAAFSPDGKRLALPRGDGVVLLDAATWEPQGAPFALPVGLPGGDWAGVKPVADGAGFTPDGKTLFLLGHLPPKAGGRADDAFVYQVIEVATRRAVHSVESKPTPFPGIWDGHGGAASGLVCGPDGKWFATAAEDRRVCVWEFGTWTLKQSFDVDCGNPPLTPFVFTREGRRIIIGDKQGLRFFDNSTARKGQVIPMPSEVRSLALSPDSETLVVGLIDGRLAMYSFKTLKPIRGVNGLGAPCVSLTYSADGKAFAAGTSDGGVVVWGGKTK